MPSLCTFCVAIATIVCFKCAFAWQMRRFVRFGFALRVAGAALSASLACSPVLYVCVALRISAAFWVAPAPSVAQCAVISPHSDVAAPSALCTLRVSASFSVAMSPSFCASVKVGPCAIWTCQGQGKASRVFGLATNIHKSYIETYLLPGLSVLTSSLLSISCDLSSLL